MLLPQVTFRGLLPSQTIIDSVWRGVRKLKTELPELEECHVVIEATKRPAKNREHYHVTVRVSGKACEPEFRTVHAVDDNVFGALSHAFEGTRQQAQWRETLLRLQAASEASGVH